MWSTITTTTSLSARRAWIEIASRRRVSGRTLWSLSARRAWIEITVVGVLATLVTVALRKESVDRNYIIKITDNRPAAVALRKESVDRNTVRNVPIDSLACRSPQGERG